jgi:hypothetical protein
LRRKYDEIEQDIRAEASRIVHDAFWRDPLSDSPIFAKSILPYVDDLVSKQVNRWGMWIATVTGGTTIAAVLASIVYVFFQLPNIALQKALDTFDARAISQVAEMNKRLVDVLQKFGSIDGRSEEAAKRLAAIQACKRPSI